jgi:2-methylcitrate dehydratase PrpD
VVKRHPCCASTHRAIDALLDLRREHRLTLDDVADIDVKVGVSAAKNLAYPDPVDEVQARFSMQYCLAAAFVRGSLSLANFTLAALFDPDVNALMKRIRMRSYSAEDERGHERLPHVVTVTLRDGETVQKQRLHAKGAREDALDEEQKRSKFADCLEWRGWVNGQLHDRLLALPDAKCMPAMLDLIAQGSPSN